MKTMGVYKKLDFKNCLRAHKHMHTHNILIPVTPTEEWENKSFVRVLHCMLDNCIMFCSCKCLWPPPALK